MTTEEVFQREMEIAEGIFGTESDPDQMPITRASAEKLTALCGDRWLESQFDEAGEPISWSVVMPTQRDLAEQFVRGEINERQFLDLTQPQDMYDALYIVSIITVPAQRGRGLASAVLTRALQKAPVTPEALFVAWPTTPEGAALLHKFQTTFPKPIQIRI